jgi:hypothetical protein
MAADPIADHGQATGQGMPYRGPVLIESDPERAW